MTIDPLDPKDHRLVEQRIRTAYGLDYRFHVDGWKELAGNNQDVVCPEDSICYRTTVKTKFHLKSRSGLDHSTDFGEVINKAFTGHIKVTRAFMVDKVTKLGFDGGVLETVAIRKPSETLAVAKLPLTVYDAVVTSALAAPGHFLSNLSGLPPSEQLEMIKKLSDNSARIKELNANLTLLRNADLATDNLNIGKDLFTIRCAGTAKAS